MRLEMKPWKLVAAGLAALAGASTQVVADAAPGVDIVVTVATFKNRDGQLGCRLYASPQGFPKQGPWLMQTGTPIGGKAQTCRFTHVAPGTYAVAVMHDENKNQTVDTNFVGAPTEGYGVSNNHTYALKAPKWEESTFKVADRDVHLSINLRY
jgi:uncharacterized protein (DUF2141 family)